MMGNPLRIATCLARGCHHSFVIRMIADFLHVFHVPDDVVYIDHKNRAA